jgi:hypothetical protein
MNHQRPGSILFAIILYLYLSICAQDGKENPYQIRSRVILFWLCEVGFYIRRDGRDVKRDGGPVSP